MAFPDYATLRDNFSGDLSNWSENIEPGFATHEIATARLRSPDAYSSNYWTAIDQPDQEAYITMITMPSSGSVRLCTRIQNPNTANADYYSATIAAAGNLYIDKIVDTTLTNLQVVGGAGTIQLGDKVGMRVVGNTLSVFRFRGVWTQIGTDQSDTSITGDGYIGIYTTNGSTACLMDDFYAAGWTTTGKITAISFKSFPKGKLRR